MKKLLFLSICSIIYSQAEENTGWQYLQSTEQSFHIFIHPIILEDPSGNQISPYGDGSNASDSWNGSDCIDNPESCDVVGAFVYRDISESLCDDLGNEGGYTRYVNEQCEICVGWSYYNSYVNMGNAGPSTTLPIMGGSWGNELYSYYTYNSETVNLKFYDASENETYNLNSDPEIGPHSNNAIYVYWDESDIGEPCYYMETQYCSNFTLACEENEIFDCTGNCVEADEALDFDCMGVCGGNASIDCAGECNGSAITSINTSTSSLYFSNTSLEEIVLIENTGDCSTLWNANSNNNWLTISPSNGNTNPGDINFISISVDINGLDIGEYYGGITINTESSESIYIPVFLSIQGPIFYSEIVDILFEPCLFGDIQTYFLPIVNLGNEILTISPEELNPPFYVSNEISILPGETDYISLELNCAYQSIELNDSLILNTNQLNNQTIEIPIYASCIPDYSPIIITIDDVENDQGGWVNIDFSRSSFDTDGLNRVESYLVEANYGNGWIMSANGNAYGNDTYTIQVHTQIDSSSTSNGLIDFRIIAGMEEGNYVSDVESGYSVDNINPSTPTNLFAFGDNNNSNISWSYNFDSDFNYHQISDFNDNLYFTTENNIQIPLNDTYNEYFINTIDMNGNVSEVSDYVSAHNLDNGVNLISFRIIPDNNFIENLFENTNINGLISEGESAILDNDGNWHGSLTHIIPNKGYWVRSTDDEILNIVGQEIDSINYYLHEGPNLISYGCKSIGLVENIISNENINGIIGNTFATTYIENIGWVGSLDQLNPGFAYWVKTDSDLDFSYDCSDSEVLLREYLEAPVNDYTPSTKQAFYFFEEIPGIEIGDVIRAYNVDILVGSRVWSGPFTDVPVMGKDFQKDTKGYITSEQAPSFKVFKRNGEQLNIETDIPRFENNGIFIIQHANTSGLIPQEFMLSHAYPNPFNPTTTINFQVPYESHVSLYIYDVSGIYIRELANNIYSPGHHSIVWNASEFSSGIYFIKMTANGFTSSQKIMLIK